jgi:hypothetical protein
MSPAGRRIAAVKVFPSIGIARLGNSPDESFIGPERPGDWAPPQGGYKDADCRVKRQAARFRIYGYDSKGGLVGEVKAADATITWTVHLANAKAAARRFSGLDPHAPLRNADAIPHVPPVTDRSELVIDPGPRSLQGAGGHATFDTGTFLGEPVPLGDMHTDADGRLLVLGGFGRSGSPAGVALTTFANNDRWFDDVSDGPVTATVRIGRSTELTAAPAWVICAPPDFAPPIESVTSLYDTLYQVFVTDGSLSEPDPPSLTHDVFPLLRRALAIESLSMMSAGKHAKLFGEAFPGVGPANRAARQDVLAKLNNPANPDVDDADMPMLWGDTYTPGKGETMTPVQYQIMRRWADGDVVDDWTGAPPRPSRRTDPDGLTRAALEACVGGPFYPGIEASWQLRDPSWYSEPFRIDHRGRAAGDITKHMAVPWQADFTDCTQDGELAWWPAQRPDDVYPEGETMQMPWTRDIVSTPDEMVRDWYKLGFVVDRDGQFVETERHKVGRQLRLVSLRDEVSVDEVVGHLGAGEDRAVFGSALFVQADGFAPAELGLDVRDAVTSELAVARAPQVTLRRPGGGRALPGVAVMPTAVHLEDRSSPDLHQRVTFEYAVSFSSAAAFDWRADAIAGDVLPATVDASVHAAGAARRVTGLFQLSRHRGPYLLDGAVPWASGDLRFFTAKQGERKFGVELGTGTGAPESFIAAVLERFNALAGPDHPFDSVPDDDTVDPTELATTVEGRPVYLFAVARVRSRVAASAEPVHVLFRLFPAASLGTDYDASSTYRRTPSMAAPIALLGRRGGDIVSVPCFASPRVDVARESMRTQTDLANRRLLGGADDAEVQAYFGCWLDVNQDAPAFPRHGATLDGPFVAPRASIQELLVAGSAAVVAQVYSPDDPVPDGATPASHPRLGQRAVVSHRVEPRKGTALATVTQPFAIRATRDVALDDVGPTDIVSELMVLWGDLPGGTDIRLYLPTLSAEAITSSAARHYEASRLERIDHHTIRLLPADISLVPLPGSHSADIPALLSVEVGSRASSGSVHRLVVHQIADATSSVLGSLGLTITVGADRRARDAELRQLAVLGDVAGSMSAEDPWRLVAERHVASLAARAEERRTHR